MKDTPFENFKSSPPRGIIMRGTWKIKKPSFDFSHNFNFSGISLTEMFAEQLLCAKCSLCIISLRHSIAEQGTEP